jgi:hypothetical protein
MIVQISLTRNELFLIKKMLPLWQKFCDAFVFMVDDSEDGTWEFLEQNKEKYNILSILKTNRKNDQLIVESEIRQRLFDEARKHSDKIICLDTDEYLDGYMTKEKLEKLLDENKNTVFHLRWMQYTEKFKVRVDGPWRCIWSADRIGSYEEPCFYNYRSMHSTHLPIPKNTVKMEINDLFVAHLQWLDKKSVALKQYYWKITDYVNRKLFNANTVLPSDYDNSVNNFNWTNEFFQFPLKVSSDLFTEDRDITKDYKWQFVKENVKKYDIPNLNDWGMEIHGD